jgi:hypothetical protein
MLKADDFRIDRKEISGWPVSVTSYKIGGKYFCHIDNEEPGTTIARSEGTTYDETMQEALFIAQQRLASKTFR